MCALELFLRREGQGRSRGIMFQAALENVNKMTCINGAALHLHESASSVTNWLCGSVFLFILAPSMSPSSVMTSSVTSSMLWSVCCCCQEGGGVPAQYGIKPFMIGIWNWASSLLVGVLQLLLIGPHPCCTPGSPCLCSLSIRIFILWEFQSFTCTCSFSAQAEEI